METLRARNAARLRAEILDAAAELFTTKGYAAVTVDELAATVGVATRTVYRHFPGKEDLALAPLRLPLAGIAERLETAEKHEEPVKLLARLVEETGMPAVPTESERRLRAVVLSDEGLRARYHAENMRLESALSGFLRRGDGLGESEARVRAGAVVGALCAAYRTAMDNGDGEQAVRTALATASAVLGGHHVH
jgi:AcrR family transcriptional regulator